MAKSENTVLSAGDVSRAVQREQVTALFQPVEALQTGVTRGFEALARLPWQGRELTPDTFLPLLGPDDRLCLFGAMLGHSIALLKRQKRAGRNFYVSINVEISLLASDDFVDILQYFLDRHDFSGQQLVLEILENEEVTDLPRLTARLEAIKALGLRLALDDIGSGYASLQKVKQLPIDICKLDRVFCRNLESKPEDLVFVMSVQLLTQGLGKRLVVEGIETPEVYDAIRLLGVTYGQGYGIARPMPDAEIDGWLARRAPRQPDRVPKCLLGAYASLLTVAESCRALKRQPLPMAWTAAATDHVNCAVGQLFGPRGWNGTTFGRAHAAFHQALPTFDSDEPGYEAAHRHFCATMAEAILAKPNAYSCVPVVSSDLTGGGEVRRPPRPVAPARKLRRAG